jgi:ABC-2 type transport system ATP-binding protein
VTNVVDATDLVKHWGATRVLERATFTIGHGITGLLGSNGAGKTTMLGMILGLHHPDDGHLRVLGLDPGTAGPRVRERIGYSPEHHLLPPDIPAHDLVRHLSEIHGLPHRDATARASDALYQVGLGEERFRPIGTMSTGQRQRVKLAVAIAHDPALVLLDEPTDGLDPLQRDHMLALIRRVGTEFGIDIILSSHLLDEIERVCDAAVILSGGSVVAAGTMADLTGSTGGIVLELDDEVNAVILHLRAHGLEVSVDGHRLHVTRPAVATAPPAGTGPANGRNGHAVADEADLNDLVRDAVAAAGAGIRTLTPTRLSLEDVFLEVGR